MCVHDVCRSIVHVCLHSCVCLWCIICVCSFVCTVLVYVCAPQVGLPPAELDCSLAEYVDIVCGEFWNQCRPIAASLLAKIYKSVGQGIE